MAKITLYIDDVAYQVDDDNNLLATVLSQKLNLPYFCWHPSMGSVGACRQCAVTQFQDENDSRGRIVMACMTPVSDGMRIGLNDSASHEFREQVIAAMMTNHPHDCPVCAEGGECHLQDMTVMTGHNVRHFHGKKRTFSNQYLGELVGHEMNRCITCYRCVRFYKDYAGGKDFGAYGSKNQVYFGRQRDGMLESAFSGNLVEVCPTGVFTNKQFSAHYSRKWDLQSAPSICSHCAVGCNTSTGERYGSVRRVMNRYDAELNGYFLCDRGRYGLGFVNGAQRLRVVRGISQTTPTHLSRLDVAKALAHYRGQRFIGIGSERASQEANSLLKLMVGERWFSTGVNEQQLRKQAQHQALLTHYPAPSLRAVEQCDFVLLLAEDIGACSPRLALSLRQALRNAGLVKAATIGVKPWMDAAVRTYAGDVRSPMYALQSQQDELDELCKHKLILTPLQIEQCVAAINEALVSARELDDIGVDMFSNSPLFMALPEPEQQFVHRLFDDFCCAEKPLLVTGTRLASAELLADIERLMTNLRQHQGEQSDPVQLVVMPEQANSVGALALTDAHTLSLEQVLQALQQHQADGVIMLEQQGQYFSQSEREQLRQHCRTLIVLDHSASAFSELADIVLPVAAVSESSGHYLNYQGLVQSFAAVHPPVLPCLESWRWLLLLDDNLIRAIHQPVASYAELLSLLQKQQMQWLPEHSIAAAERGVARQTPRASGRTSMTANLSVHEPKATVSRGDDYRFSMEGRPAFTTLDMPFTWAPGWNSNQAIGRYQLKINGELVQQRGHSEHYASFEQHAQLLARWPLTDGDNGNISARLRRTFVATPPWMLAEWQARFNPEFLLMYGGNELTLSVELANSLTLDPGDYVKIQLAGVRTLAKIHIDARLPVNLLNGFLLELPDAALHYDVELAPASEDDIAQFKQQEQQRRQQAEQQKQQVLAALKIRDQQIPIRLVAGGLDDV